MRPTDKGSGMSFCPMIGQILRLGLVGLLLTTGSLQLRAGQPPCEFWLQLLNSDAASVRLAGVVQISQWAGLELPPDERLQGTLLIPKLTALMEDDHREVRLASVRALGRLGIEAAALFPSFQKALECSDRELRQITLEAVIRYLMDNARSVQLSTGASRPRIVSQFMQDAADLAPLLASSLHDADPAVRWTALSGLENLLLRTQTLFPGHTRHPTPGLANADTRRKLIQWVGEWTTLATALVPRVKAGSLSERLLAVRVLEVLADWAMDFDRESQALGLVGEEKQAWQARLREVYQSLPDLFEDLETSPVRLQLGVLAVLEAMDHHSAHVREQVQPFLRHPQRFVRWAALRTLAKWGAPRQSEEWQRVVILLEDADVDVRQAASRTLLFWVADQESSTVGPAFVMKGEAMHGNMEASMLMLMHPLMRIVSQGEPEQQEAALATLGWLGRDAYPAHSVCLRALQSAEPRIRKLIPDVLVKIAPLDPETGRALEAALTDADDEVKTAAAHALLRWRERQK